MNEFRCSCSCIVYLRRASFAQSIFRWFLRASRHLLCIENPGIEILAISDVQPQWHHPMQERAFCHFQFSPHLCTFHCVIDPVKMHAQSINIILIYLSNGSISINTAHASPQCKRDYRWQTDHGWVWNDFLIFVQCVFASFRIYQGHNHNWRIDQQ